MADVNSFLTQRLQQALATALGGEYAKADPMLRVSNNPQFGDYQANAAMGLAKAAGAKPREVAQKIVDALDVKGICTKVEIAGPGFVNLHLSDAFLAGQVEALGGDERLGVSCAAGQRVVVDYSGPNVAKEMHVGHLRSSVIGDALARVLAFSGHTVIRQNHLGDWGTQFGMLIEHLQDSCAGGSAAGMQLQDLNAFYQQAKKRFDGEPEFAQRARQRVVALQGGDEATLSHWRALIQESTRHFNGVYQRLGVQLTDADIRAESFYNPYLPGIVGELEAAGLAVMSQGALCVFPKGFVSPEGEPTPLIIRKSDGGYLYATTDLAAIRYRLTELGASRLIYVTDARQNQHFAMVFATARAAGWVKDSMELEHVPFGTVLGEDGKPFKTRSGEVVKLADLLDEAQTRAMAIVTQKNPQLSSGVREEVAKAIGIGAVKYADLSNDRVKDYVFSWDRMLAFDGNTAPYLQNAYVRIRSIFRKAADQKVDVAAAMQQPIGLTTPAERALALTLLQFAPAVAAVAVSLEPHRLCTYLYDLATMYHRFYEACPVLTAPDEATRNTRLRLSDLTAKTLATGLGLLGISVVEQM